MRRTAVDDAVVVEVADGGGDSADDVGGIPGGWC